jgi:uncharacterized membrane protein
MQNIKQNLVSMSAGGLGGAVIGYFFFPGIIDIAVSSSIGAIMFNSFSNMVKSIYEAKKIKDLGPPLTVEIKKTTIPRANERD